MDTTQSALAALKDIIEPWTNACLERDWDALLGMCTADIVFMPSGEPSKTGPEVRPWLEGFPEITEMSWDVSTVEAEGSLAFARGPVKQTLRVDGKDQVVDAKFCDLLRKESDGQWRFAVIAWSPNSQ